MCLVTDNIVDDGGVWSTTNKFYLIQNLAVIYVIKQNLNLKITPLICVWAFLKENRDGWNFTILIFSNLDLKYGIILRGSIFRVDLEQPCSLVKANESYKELV
jgi:hypothetical protein